MKNPETLLEIFYPDDTPLRKKLCLHSSQVQTKALEIAVRSPVKVDLEIVSTGAVLHDIGIGRCHAPSIHCEGSEPYIRHGILGAEMLRQLDPSLECFARICERHTGSGLTAEEIRFQGLPLPCRDFLPETPEEKLICLADKFFSKSGNMQEKSLDNICRAMEKFGSASLLRFKELLEFFKY